MMPAAESANAAAGRKSAIVRIVERMELASLALVEALAITADRPTRVNMSSCSTGPRKATALERDTLGQGAGVERMLYLLPSRPEGDPARRDHASAPVLPSKSRATTKRNASRSSERNVTFLSLRGQTLHSQSTLEESHETHVRARSDCRLDGCRR